MAHSIRLTRIVRHTEQLVSQLQRLHFASIGQPAGAWSPSINVYAYDDRIEACVDLAGVPKSDIEVHVEPRRLAIRGERPSPEQACKRPPCGRILVMEIPEGTFERVIEFPFEINPAAAEARQDNGWLWICMPVAQ